MTHKPRLALGLVHHPILDREKRIVATNVTNFDIHDIARAATVYGVEKYYIIHPLEEQLMFVERILDHWRVGHGSKFNPYRKTALDPVRTVKSIDEAIRDWNVGSNLIKIATHARAVPGVPEVKTAELKRRLFDGGEPCLLLFGTGFGMPDDLMQTMDGVL